MMVEQGNKPKVGLVIGSGSIKCAAALGLWKVLERNGIKLDMVVGCSGGSIYAAGIAFDDEIAQVEETTLRLWTQDLMSGYASNLRAAMTGKSPWATSPVIIPVSTSPIPPLAIAGLPVGFINI